jgi:hypothetical protein
VGPTWLVILICTSEIFTTISISIAARGGPSAAFITFLNFLFGNFPCCQPYRVSGGLIGIGISTKGEREREREREREISCSILCMWSTKFFQICTN